MTPADLRAARAELGWSCAQLGRRVGRSGTNIAEMEHAPGKRPIPVAPDVAYYVQAAVTALRKIQTHRATSNTKKM